MIEVVQNSYPTVDENDYHCELLEAYTRKIQGMETEQKKIIEHMPILSQNRKEYQILQSFPGIQDTLACRLIAEPGDLMRFENNKQINACAGIDIGRYQSGNMEYKDRINKRVNSRLRAYVLYDCLDAFR